MKESETDIKLRIKHWLDLQEIFSWHILQGVGCYRGAPDKIIFLDGRAVMLEIKRPRAKLSEHQLEFQAQCERDGIPYWVVHDEKELEEFIQREGKAISSVEV